MKTTRALALCSSMLLAAACGGDDGTGGDDDVPTARTYYQDVKPILDAKCGGCHSDDGIAPFSLTTYDEVVNSAPPSELAAAIRDELMPPWPPNPDCNEYYADRSLTADHKAILLDWIENGMAEGDAANPAPPLELEEIRLSRVDLRMDMPVTYTTTATAQYPDEYRCFVIRFPETMTTPKFVTGFRAVPGNPKVVHHVIAFYASPSEVAAFEQLDADEEGPGYTCFGGPGIVNQNISWIGGWAPGSMGSDFPEGSGIRVEPGAAVILQLHYNILAAGALPDRSAIELKLDDTVEKVATIQPFANPNWLNGNGMRIPAGDPDVMHAFQFDLSIVRGGREFTIWSVGTHQHELGSRNSISLIRGGGGGTECLLQIDDWNFHWQGNYGLRQPVRVRPGDQIRVECHWDNSPENQPIVNGTQQPPRDVYWGEGTGDEMCLAGFYITD